MMPDSRYAISNVEWPDHRDGTRHRDKGPFSVSCQTGYYRPDAGPDVVPAFAYEELLEVAEDMARFIEWTENNRGYLAVRVMPNDIQDAGQKALANFRASSTPTRTRNEK